MTDEKKKPDEIPVSEELLAEADAEVIAASADALENIAAELAGDSAKSGSSDSGPAKSDAPPAADLQSKLAEAEKEVLRVQADMDNFRKRTRRDMADQIRYASLPLITELVDVIDNLQRAIDAAEANESAEGLLEGVKMVSTHLAEILQQHGCHKIESVGQPFDPNCHEAIQMQPSEKFEANTVSMETRTGYKLHERVIRPAQVFVSTGPKSEAE